MSLRAYRSKRRLSRSGEPTGRQQARVRRRGAAGFVVQKHDARRLHYDFRLEMDGVLKSWALPKGLPLARGEKRLAVQVEDHPLEYGRFEGIIPPGNYGAGTVMVWDCGRYEVAEEDAVAALDAGRLAIELHGKKLQGRWALVRLRKAEDDKTWLLIKTGENARRISIRADNASVQSRRSLKQIAAAASRVWRPRSGRRSNRPRSRTASRL